MPALLVRAAVPLMERSGSQAVSMQSIAAAAGVSVGLIYRYFASKQELVRAVTEGVLEDMRRLLAEALEEAADPLIASRTDATAPDANRHCLKCLVMRDVFPFVEETRLTPPPPASR